MTQIQQAWRFMIIEPSGWLHSYFFKTNMFMTAFQTKDRAERFKILLRLVLPMFLIIYPLTVIFSLLFTLFIPSHLNWLNLLVASAAGTLSGFFIGIAWEQITGRTVGILASMWLGVCLGTWAGVSWLMWSGILLATTGGIALGAGVVQEFGKVTTQNIEENQNYLEDLRGNGKYAYGFKDMIEFIYELLGTYIFYFIRGSGPGIEREYRLIGPYYDQEDLRERIETRPYYFVRGTSPILEEDKTRIRNIGITIIRYLLANIALLILIITINSIGILGDVTSIWWAVVLGTSTGILAGITLNLVRNKWIDWATGVGSGIAFGIMLRHITQLALPALLFTITPTIVTLIAWGIGWYMGAKGTGSIRKTVSLLLVIGMASGIIAGYLASWMIIIVFLLCYCISYYQLPLWIMSYIAITTTKPPDRHKASEIFAYLRASSLYWDPWEVLPLPGLEKIMCRATEQNIEQAIEVMNFIKEHRPLHIKAALNGLQAGFFYLDMHSDNIRERGTSEIFMYLRSLLRWNEWEVLPLSNLTTMMCLAAEQDIEQAMEIMDFISMDFVRDKEERSLQVEAALDGLQDDFLNRITRERSVPEVFIYLRNLQRWNLWAIQYCPNLTIMIQAAIEQDIEQTKEIMTFIERVGPSQLEAARIGLRTGFLTLVAHEMEMCKTLRDISGAIQQFMRLQSLISELHIADRPDRPGVAQATGKVGSPGYADSSGYPEQEDLWWASVEKPPSRPSHRAPSESSISRRPTIEEWRRYSSSTEHRLPSERSYPRRFPSIQPPLYSNQSSHQTSFSAHNVKLEELLALLIDVCLDATHYRNSLSWQTRDDALQHMIAKLEKIKENPNYQHLHLFNVVNHWISTAQHELDKLQQESQRTHEINNPYIVGQALQPGTSLFVGRLDLVHQLEQGLRRGSHRPTFFLNGERRMGKSSTLRQLPHLLDNRLFLPIFFDLQAPEITSSTAAFLNSIAEKINETMEASNLQIKPLEKKSLQIAMQENEARVYYVFDEWLKATERILEQQERIVLLSFDEFENLEVVGKMHYLDLHLLLNWFRSTIQNRPQLALLFSGGKSVGEMGGETDINWSGYFVNVQTFRVGFLREAEARQLITQPVPDYPIQQIFGDGVVDEIIRVTGCHPFLVQAVCSNLVNNLNADSRNHAELQDVEIAVKQVLDDWEDSYFQDLWTRTNTEQRACLIALNDLNKGNIQQIAQQIDRKKEPDRATLQVVRHTLQLLFKRDLVLLENENYCIATPIFSQWVERNS